MFWTYAAGFLVMTGALRPFPKQASQESRDGFFGPLNLGFYAQSSPSSSFLCKGIGNMEMGNEKRWPWKGRTRTDEELFDEALRILASMGYSLRSDPKEEEVTAERACNEVRGREKRAASETKPSGDTKRSRSLSPSPEKLRSFKDRSSSPKRRNPCRRPPDRGRRSRTPHQEKASSPSRNSSRSRSRRRSPQTQEEWFRSYYSFRT